MSDVDWRTRALDAEAALADVSRQLDEAHLAAVVLIGERDDSVGCCARATLRGIEYRAAIARRDGAIDALTRRVSELLSRPGCQHDRITRGAEVPRRWGGYPTEVCRDCGAFRTTAPSGEHPSAWHPASKYAEATATTEME